MTAKEFLEKQILGYDHFTRLTKTGISPDEDNIALFAEDYHKHKLKLLLIDFLSKIGSSLEAGITNEQIVSDYLYEINL